MPRPKLGARLYFRKDDKTWVIRDGDIQRRTGCGLEDRKGAEEQLADYIINRHEPPKRESRLSALTVADTLNTYAREHAPTLHDAERAGDAVLALLSWEGWTTLSAIRASLCRSYADFRRSQKTHQSKHVSNETIRRELAVLNAAIRYWHAEHGPLDVLPVITKPDRGEPRSDYMTRSQAAVILAGFLGWYVNEAGEWKRDPSMALPHLARYFLIGIYTGTRSDAILSVQWMPNTTGGWIDFESGVLYRAGRFTKQTKKRKTPVKIGTRLLAHLARWKRMDDAIRDKAAAEAGQPVNIRMHVVSWGGRRIKEVRNGWRVVLKRVGMERAFTPHHMRHTRATWMMQENVPMFEAAGSLGMSIHTLENVYAHHRPDWQKRASEV